MDTVNDVVKKMGPQPQPLAPPPGDELTDEDLEVVVGGLGRPWLSLPALRE